MSKFIIEGGIPLKGEFSLAGAKNAALKMMAAALLTPEVVVLQNVPRISDCDDMLEALQFLGVRACWTDEHEVTIEAKNLTIGALPVELAKKTRVSFLIFGGLLARLGEAVVPDPGGDKIGRRPVDRHIKGMKDLGFDIWREDGFYHGKGKMDGGVFCFLKNSHMGTENLIISSVFSNGTVVLKNAAQEPEVDDLIEMLNLIGAKIKRVEPRTIEIEGVESLRGGKFQVMPDRIEAATVATAAVITRGDVFIKGARAEDLTAFLAKLEAVGGNYQVVEGGIQVWGEKGKKFTSVDVITTPHPGFMTDWGSPFAVLLTQADGVSTLHETIYPDRLCFCEELSKMGAEVQFFNPIVEEPDVFYNFNPEDDDPSYFHAVKIFGPTSLSGTQINAADIRAGAALVVAALSAKGQSEVSGMEHIKRGYEELVERLKNLGAKIEEET